VVITSTSSPHYVITRELMQGVVKARRHRPLFLIDIAVPRDVDPRIENMDNVFLFDIDDLQQVANQNIAARKREAEQAERIVDEEVTAFEDWRRSLDVTPTLVALRARVRLTLRGELERTLPRLKSLTEAERKSLDAMCEAMVNKLLHRPLTELKKSRDEPDGAQLIESVTRLFELSQSPVSAPPEAHARSAQDQESSLPRALVPSETPSGEGQ